MNTRGKIVTAVIVTALVTSTATMWGCRYILRNSAFNQLGASGEKLTAIKTILDSGYLYDYDKEKANEYALAGYVASLDEPYTGYYMPDIFRAYSDNISEGYTGIGIIVSVNDKNQIEVIAPYEGSPAYDAGVLPGDILKSVDGTDYSGSEMSEAVNKIRGGTAGTTVDLVILRNETEEIPLTIERRNIVNNSVKSELLEDDIGYMRVTAFNMASEGGTESTSGEFKEQLSSLEGQGAKGVIIDLRDNPGGVLTEACDMADLLLPEGIITYTEDKKGRRTEYKSDEEHTDIPVVILINQNSASASEVFTGALKDYGRAEVVGVTSYGKGIVQSVIGFADGSGLSYTSAKYFTPNGVCIHEIGIEPDIKVEMPGEYGDKYASTIDRSEDVQFQKALELIKKK